MFTGSPWLIASYYVLHRLLLPRHPPCTLSHLTIQLKNNLFLWASFANLELLESKPMLMDKMSTALRLEPKTPTLAKTLHNTLNEIR